MSQGPRRGWVRTVLAGLGAVLCAGVVGCTDMDKPKDTRGKQPAPLAGTPRIPGAPGSGLGASGVGINGNSPYNSTVGGGVYQGSGTGRTPSGTGFGTSNMPIGNSTTYNNTVPSVAPNGYTNSGTLAPAGGTQWAPNPATGAGMGYTPGPGDTGPLPPPAPGTNSTTLPPGYSPGR